MASATAMPLRVLRQASTNKQRKRQMSARASHNETQSISSVSRPSRRVLSFMWPIGLFMLANQPLGVHAESKWSKDAFAQVLDRAAFRVMAEGGTEPPFTSPLDKVKLVCCFRLLSTRTHCTQQMVVVVYESTTDLCMHHFFAFGALSRNLRMAHTTALLVTTHCTAAKTSSTVERCDASLVLLSLFSFAQHGKDAIQFDLKSLPVHVCLLLL